MFGLANMFDFLNHVRELVPSLEVMGIVVTKADGRKGYFRQTMETLRDMEGIRLMESVIRVDSNIEWAQDNSAPVVDVKDYSYFIPVDVMLSDDPINPKKVPVYPGNDNDKLLTYADLGDIIFSMKEIYETTGDSDKVDAVLDQVVVLSDKSALRISSLDFSVTPEGDITELNYRGFYLYNQ